MNNNTSLSPQNYDNEKESFWSKQFFIKTLLNGLLLILPIIIVLFLLSLIFKLLFNVIAPLSALLDQNAESHTWFINILALLILVLFIFIFGLVLRNRRGQLYFNKFERRYLVQIPLYTSIKETVTQFSGVKKMPFSQVVLVDAYGTEVFLTGFVTEEITDDLYTIFVPTAPNPMNGNIYHVPKKQLKFLDIESEKAMKSIVGMGTGSSLLFKAQEKMDYRHE
ncbi:hypothetical protein GCM10027429_20800 [Marivirga atlantica]|jgi:uncharacterized membrane protein|uniref:DUF502 domain-containing protein n=1 Tax=Marivirga atlantica TaxID=1548457 RepID=A0A937A8G0_9BACT|nr:DUF502 domain-containing protein [Marivirga atlantica]MBL0765697.1 DUF502 domain-containing protein [Marivirga atlantica]